MIGHETHEQSDVIERSFLPRIVSGMSNGRSVISGIGIGVVLALVSPATAGRSSPPPKNPQVAEIERRIAGREGEPAEVVFKNIQIFKGMPAGRVTRIMEAAFSANLGVECSHCHTVDAWETDAKPQKAIARAMWTLRSDVQERVRTATGKADVAVTCYTCHKGRAKPAFQPDK